jgi:pimeloyl-ACP methyl ester carboxylesterase
VQVWDGRAWVACDGGDTSAGAVALGLAAAPPRKPRKKKSAADGAPAGDDAAADVAAVPSAPMSRGEAQALLEAKYCLEEGYFTPQTGGVLLQRLAPLLAARVPAVAVHGRADALCPVASAWALHAAWPDLELRVVAAEGHSMYQRGVQHALLCATDAFRELPL